MPTTADASTLWTMALSDDVRIALDGKWRHVREQARKDLAELDLAYDHDLTLDEARARVLEQMHKLVPTGIPAAGFRVESGGTGDPGMAVTGIEMLAQFDLSLMVKAGVQWGLFGGAIENLGTERHHKKYIPGLINLDIIGCFAMTETGHGSDVQSLETTATYDLATEEFVINSPTPSSRKDYIGGAAAHAQVAAVFAQLITKGENHGVHCFVVPLRDDEGNDLPGITTSDDKHKGGLGAVDNGRIVFDHVRIPRENLLNKYGQVDQGGTYSSPIDSVNAAVLHDARHADPRSGQRRRIGERRDRGRAQHRRAIRPQASPVRPRAGRRDPADGLPHAPASPAAADRPLVRLSVRAEPARRPHGQAADRRQP